MKKIEILGEKKKSPRFRSSAGRGRLCYPFSREKSAHKIPISDKFTLKS